MLLHASLVAQPVGTRRASLADAWISQWRELTPLSRTVTHLASNFVISRKGVNRKTIQKNLTKVSKDPHNQKNPKTIHSWNQKLLKNCSKIIFGTPQRVSAKSTYLRQFLFQAIDQTRRLASSKPFGSKGWNFYTDIPCRDDNKKNSGSDYIFHRHNRQIKNPLVSTIRAQKIKINLKKNI